MFVSSFLNFLQLFIVINVSHVLEYSARLLAYICTFYLLYVNDDVV